MKKIIFVLIGIIGMLLLFGNGSRMNVWAAEYKEDREGDKIEYENQEEMVSQYYDDFNESAGMTDLEEELAEIGRAHV